MEKEIQSQASKFFSDLLSSDSDEEEIQEKIEENASSTQQRREVEIEQESKQVIQIQEERIPDQELLQIKQEKEEKQQEAKQTIEAGLIAPSQMKHSELLQEQTNQKALKVVPNLFAEDDSLEINLDSVLFSNSALCLENSDQYPKEAARPQNKEDQRENKLKVEEPVVQEMTDEEEKESPEKLKKAVQFWIANPEEVDSLLSALQRYNSNELEDLKNETIRLLQQAKKYPGLSFKQITARILEEEMKSNPDQAVTKTEFSSLAKSEQLQIPQKFEHLPQLLLLGLITGQCSSESLINDYIERVYSLSDPFFAFVKIFLGQGIGIIENQAFLKQYQVCIPYFEKMSSSLMTLKVEKFWGAFLEKYSQTLPFSELIRIGISLGFKRVESEIERRIKEEGRKESQEEMECFYWLLNEEIPARERIARLNKEQKIHRIRRVQNIPTRTIQQEREPQPLQLSQPKEIAKQEPKQTELQVQKPVVPSEQKSSGLFGFIKKLVTTDEPIKRPQEIEEVKPKAYYYDHDLKTWIINGKPADNEHDDNILGLDEAKKEPIAKPVQERIDEKQSPLPTEIPEQRKSKPPPKYKPEEKKELTPATVPPPPKLLPIPKPFEPNVIPSHPQQQKEVSRSQGAQISNPFTFSQNSGAGKVQNSRLRNLGSRYANPF